jgi:hypothetical protein
MSSLIVTNLEFEIQSCCQDSFEMLEETELVGKDLLSIIRIDPKTNECHLTKNNRRLFCNKERQARNYIFRIKGTVSLLDPQEEQYLMGRTDKMTAFTLSQFGLITECLLSNEFLGFQPQEMMYRPIMNFVHLDDLVALFGSLKQPIYRIRIAVRWIKRPETLFIPPAQSMFLDTPSTTSNHNSTRRKSIAEGSYALHISENVAQYQWVEITITKKQETILFVRILEYPEIPSQTLVSALFEQIKSPKKVIRTSIGHIITLWRFQVQNVKVLDMLM